jgi:hypothetical protein
MSFEIKIGRARIQDQNLRPEYKKKYLISSEKYYKSNVRIMVDSSLLPDLTPQTNSPTPHRIL